MKRILLLGDINSSHLIKWAVSLKNAGNDVSLFSLSEPDTDWYTEIGISAVVGQSNSKKDFKSSDFFKLRYLSSLRRLKRLISSTKPEILHAHYASSYGFLGALVGFDKYFISVWGSDVFSFPKKSFLHRFILKYSFSKAKVIFSASRIMAEEASKYTDTYIEVIPFGVDTDRFYPTIHTDSVKSNEIVIGTIKSLEPIYGIDILIKAFSELKIRLPEHALKLLIVGDGSLRNELKQLTDSLKLNNVEFTGLVQPKDTPDLHRRIDIFANLSYMESFGVSVIEAMACGKPVVVSAIGGLAEITNEECAILVKVGNIKEVTEAFEKLILHPDLRVKLGMNGVKRVNENYVWSQSVQRLLEFYN